MLDVVACDGIAWTRHFEVSRMSFFLNVEHVQQWLDGHGVDMEVEGEDMKMDFAKWDPI
jgi:hypothetical protein